MLVIALFCLAGIFLLLGVVRFGGARRSVLARQAPAIGLGAVAMYLVLRGQLIFALGLSLLAAGFWFYTERAQSTPPRPAKTGVMSQTEARAILGVGAMATAAEIRAAHRSKMQRAHPDLGGSTEHAAKLNAARDVLLRG